LCARTKVFTLQPAMKEADTNQTEMKVRAVLMSVGGSPEPLLVILRRHRPEQVWYFCSVESRSVAEEVQAQLEWRPLARYVEVERFEELGPCYRELRRKIPELLAESKIPRSEVLVDYTGGSKTMSAALVLAAVEWFHRFSYIGGEKRDKGGLGIVVGGTERCLYQGNPWEELAVREGERAKVLWDQHHYEAAAGVLSETAPRVARRLRFEALAEVARGMAARHRMDFGGARSHLHGARGRLRPMFEGREDAGLLEMVGTALEICESCAEGGDGELLLRELLDNALRTAGQGRYEDAAARLYRAMELQGQLWLEKATDGLMRHGRCSAEKWSALPEALKALPFCRPDEGGSVRLSLEQVFRALAALGDEQALGIVADLEQGVHSRWRRATEKRNAGILAHGITPVGREGFEEMKQLATDFLGFDLTRESHPIPKFDLRWLE